MKNKSLIRFLESFVLLPVITVSMPIGGLPNLPKTDNIEISPKIVLSQKLNTEADRLLALNQAAIDEAQILLDQANAIDSYFESHDMPLKGLGAKMVEEAHKNDLDYRLIPAIAVRESTGGKHTCKKAKFNPFGWGSCKIGFKSYEDAVTILAKNLGGNNPNTARHYGGAKTIKELLQKYNPPSIVPAYASEVMTIMDNIGGEDMIIKADDTDTSTT